MPRRAPDFALPATTFVAGRSARPPEGWFDDVPDRQRFAFGCDLFDAGFFFEAHELWESCWHAAKARAERAADDDEREGAALDERLLRGLIHLAAAGVKLLDDKPDSRQRHVARAEELLCGVEPTTRGLDAAALRGAADALRAGVRPVLA